MPGKIEGQIIGRDIEYRVTSECPYCGYSQEIRIDRTREIVLCDIDEGGCDRFYVARIVSKEVFGETLRIEGEEA